MRTNYKTVALAALIALSLPALSFAAYLKADKTIVIDQSVPIAQNAYVAGADVSVSAPVQGDLMAAGANMRISSQVSQDLFVAGGTVILSGSAQDARVVGGTLLVGGAYSGELMAAGGQINVGQGTTIAKDSYIAGGSVDFSGTEQGNLTIAAGTAYVNGTVHGNLIVHARQSVRFGSNAVIDGTVEYTSPEAATVDAGAKITGAVTYHPVAPQENKYQALRSSPETIAKIAGFISVAVFLAWIAKFLVVLAAAYAFWFALRAETGDMVKRAGTQFWKSLFVGFIVLVTLPIAALIACATIIGAIPGIIGFLVYAVLLVAAMPMAGIITGSFLFKRRADLAWYQIALGVFAFMLIKLIPFIGWLAWFVLYVISLGAVSQALWQHWIKKRS